MNFDFSPEQHALRDQVARLFATVSARKSAVETDSLHDETLWRQLVDMGLTAAAIPEDLGGAGLGALELCVLAEEAGRTLAPIPLSSSVLYATEALKLCTPSSATERCLAKLATGAQIGTIAFSELAGTWDARPAVQVRGGLVYGTKPLVPDGLLADVALVSACAEEDGDGHGWWLVDLHGEGVRRRAAPSLDCVRRYARIELEGAPCVRLGAPGEGGALATRLLDIAAILTSFEQIGGAEAQLAVTVDYAKTRRAFGSPIGVNQAVKHRLADMYAKIELARGHAWFGAWALSTAAPELPLAAAGARLAATDAFCFAAEEAIELHGGIGFTWESDCHLYYRRARGLALELGGRAHWADRLVRALEASAP